MTNGKLHNALYNANNILILQVIDRVLYGGEAPLFEHKDDPNDANYQLEQLSQHPSPSNLGRSGIVDLIAECRCCDKVNNVARSQVVGVENEFSVKLANSSTCMSIYRW